MEDGGGCTAGPLPICVGFLWAGDVVAGKALSYSQTTLAANTTPEDNENTILIRTRDYSSK